MKSKLASNPAKKILCLALCAIMLIAMLPVMTVPAYAAVGEVVEIGSVWIQYVDCDTGEEIAEPTLLHYEDLTDGAYQITIPEISGYAYRYAQSFVEEDEQIVTAHQRKIKGGYWFDYGHTEDLHGTLQNEDDWAKYKVTFSCIVNEEDVDKEENGFVLIRGFKRGRCIFRDRGELNPGNVER